MTAKIGSLISTVAVAAALLLVAGHGEAQSTKSDRPAKSDKADDLDSFLCKDIMRMSGDDRVVATSVLHGYTLGKKNTTRYVVADLTKITDAFVEHCLSNPNDKALQAFTRLAK